jgi:hypothetical protein
LRNVGPDGNCYYRVVFYGALEHHLLAGNYSGVQGIYDKLVHFIDLLGVSDLLQVLLRLIAKQCPLADVDGAVSGEVAAAQLAQLITADAKLDMAIVMACKHLLVTEIRQQRDAGVLVRDATWDVLCDTEYASFDRVCLLLLLMCSTFFNNVTQHESVNH